MDYPLSPMCAGKGWSQPGAWMTPEVATPLSDRRPRRPADEVLEALVRLPSEVPVKKERRDPARLAAPSHRWLLEHVHDLQVGHVQVQLVELLAEDHVVPVAVGVEEDRRPHVVADAH